MSSKILVLPGSFDKKVFLASLAEKKGLLLKTADRVKKELIFKESIEANNSDFSEKIQSALNFLLNVAASESNKEQRAINNYKLKIQKHYNNPKTPPVIKENLRKQLEKLEDIDVNSNEQAVITLINQINTLEQDVNRYDRRLKELINSKKDPKHVFKTPEYRMQDIIQDFFLNQSAKRKKSKYYNFYQIIKTRLEKEIKNKMSSFPSIFHEAISAAILTDFTYWLEDTKNTFLLDLNEDDTDELNKKMNQLFDEYFNNSNPTHLLLADEETLKEIEQDMQNHFGFEYIDTKQLAEYKKWLNENKNNKKAIFNGKTYNQVAAAVKRGNYNINSEAGKKLIFNFISSTGHGNFYEIVRSILQSSINVQANIGADIIAPIGTCTFSTDLNDILQHNELTNLSRKLAAIYSTAFNEQEKITLKNFNQAVEQQKKISQLAQEELQKTAQQLNLIKNETKEFFITHESLKLYRSREQNTSTDAFHGRKMAILSALAKLYSIANLAGGLLDIDILISFLLNISPDTLGSNNKAPLETYLSIFAGLLMFDDMSSFISQATFEIGQNAQQTENATVEQLHVYNIGGVYLPISIILNNLVEQIEASISTGTLEINSNRTAIASLYYPSSIKEKSPTSQENWESVENEVISNTYIQISFLSGFIEYISSIFNEVK